MSIKTTSRMSFVDEEQDPARGSDLAYHDGDGESISSSVQSDDSVGINLAGATSDDPLWQTLQPVQLPVVLGEENADLADEDLVRQEWAIYEKTNILGAVASDTKQPDIRLLQVQPDVSGQPIHCRLVKRPLWDSIEYYAISYSWRKEPRSREILITVRDLSRRSIRVSPHLWNALNRLRGKQQVINVWVDAICINQNNIVERSAQVRIMAQIFNQAAEVRIWLGDPDESETLPVSDVKLFTSLCQQPFPWWTRLWVVQECAYANKCPVIMLGGHLINYFDMIERWAFVSRTALESDGADIELLRSNLQLFQTPFTVWKTQSESNRHRLPLFQRLQENAQRQCTVIHDRIYALLSLIEEHEEKQILPDYQKPFMEVVDEMLNIVRRSPSWNEARDVRVFRLLDLRPISGVSYDGTFHRDRDTLAKAIPKNFPVKRAHFEAQTRLHSSVLYVASLTGHENNVRTSIDAGADVNAREGQRGNALQAATFRGHENIVRILIDAGADVNAREGQHGNALQAATLRGYDNIVQMLIDVGADVNARGGHFSNALQIASSRGHDNIVRMLIDAGANVNARGGHFSNALQIASLHGHDNIVQMLIDAGANVNAQRRPYGNNALQAALSRGHNNIVRMLLDAGADVNTQAGQYSSALRAALVGGSEKVVQMLMNAGTYAATEVKGDVDR